MDHLDTWFFVLLLAACTVANAAETAKSVDASGFDVAGVKLGMTPAEAVAAAAIRLQIDKRAIEFDQFPKKNVVTQSKEPKYFTAKSGLARLNVYFTPRVPFDKARPMAVSFIFYEIPWTADNFKAMRAAALKKYGPTSNGIVGATYEWCENPSKNIGEGCFEAQEPKLSLSNTRLELVEPRYDRAVNNFINKMQSAAPGF